MASAEALNRSCNGNGLCLNLQRDWMRAEAQATAILSENDSREKPTMMKRQFVEMVLETRGRCTFNIEASIAPTANDANTTGADDCHLRTDVPSNSPPSVMTTPI